ncbi:MAG: hypothetical protein H6702_07755 [Myxococcales bacterium]|nr:hypothetical protein [Myxococcales bacterium]
MEGAASGTWQAAGIRLLERLDDALRADPQDAEGFTETAGGLGRHLRRLLRHVDRAVLDLDHGIPRVNGRALWLERDQLERVARLSRWLAPAKAAGIAFSGEPSPEAVARLRAVFERLAQSGKAPRSSADVEAVLARAEVQTIHLVSPGGLETGLTDEQIRVAWHYARCVAGMESALYPGEIPYHAVHDLAEGLARGALADPPLMAALALSGGPESVGRRAADVAVLCALWSVAQGESEAEVAEWATIGLLHEAGRTYTAADEAWPAGARICVLGVRQLDEAPDRGRSLGDRVTAALEHGLLLSRAPFVEVRHTPHVTSQVVAVARAILRGIRRGLSAFEVGSRLVGRGPKDVDPGIVSAMVSLIGPYPIGTLLELTDESLGVVWDQPWAPHQAGQMRRPVATVIERMVDGADRPLPGAERLVTLGEPGPDGQPWQVHRTLKRAGAPALVASVLIRRAHADAVRLGLR